MAYLPNAVTTATAGRPYSGSGAPGLTHDSADTAALGRTFRAGDTWHSSTTHLDYHCIDATAGAARWLCTGFSFSDPFSDSAVDSFWSDVPDGATNAVTETTALVLTHGNGEANRPHRLSAAALPFDSRIIIEFHLTHDSGNDTMVLCGFGTSNYSATQEIGLNRTGAGAYEAVTYVGGSRNAIAAAAGNAWFRIVADTVAGQILLMTANNIAHTARPTVWTQVTRTGRTWTPGLQFPFFVAVEGGSVNAVGSFRNFSIRCE